MKENKSIQRKLLAARLDLTEKISELALRKGTLYDYVNDILEQTIKIDSMGLTLREIYDEMSIFRSAKAVGFALLPEALVMGLAEKAYKGEGKESLEKLFFENGQWYGKYYGDIALFEEMMKKYLWSTSEFDIKKNGKTRVLTCLGSSFSEEYSKLLCFFFEGAMESLGFKSTSKDVAKGIIRISFH
jgi:hypothetical protein